MFGRQRRLSCMWISHLMAAPAWFAQWSLQPSSLRFLLPAPRCLLRCRVIYHFIENSLCLMLFPVSVMSASRALVPRGYWPAYGGAWGTTPFLSYDMVVLLMACTVQVLFPQAQWLLRTSAYRQQTNQQLARKAARALSSSKGTERLQRYNVGQPLDSVSTFALSSGAAYVANDTSLLLVLRGMLEVQHFVPHEHAAWAKGEASGHKRHIPDPFHM